MSLAGDISQEALAEGNLDGLATRDTNITLGRDKAGMQSLADLGVAYQDFHGGIESASNKPSVWRSATCIELFFLP